MEMTSESWSWSRQIPKLPKTAEVYAIFAGGEDNMDNRTFCNKCSHFGVCTYKDDYLKLRTTIDELVIDVANKDSTVKKICVRDIPFIKPINLVCKFYSTDILFRDKEGQIDG